MNKTLKQGSVVIFCLLSLVIYAIISGGEEHIAPSSTPVNSIQMIDTVKNNGPASVDNEIIFSGKCTGQETRLIVCRNIAASCDTGTLPGHLICLSQRTNEEEKSCKYITTIDDVGEHLQDSATCCDEQGKCAEATTTIDKWAVTTAPLTIKDDADNHIRATFDQQETLLTVSFVDQPITKLHFTAVEGNEIGVSQSTRGIVPPEGVEFTRVYGLDLEEIAFTEATMYATAQGSSLYICKFWDFALSTCVGSWELVKPLQLGQEYSFNLMKGSFGFAEATAEVQPTVQSTIEQPSEEPIVEEPVISEPQPEPVVPAPEPIVIEEPSPEVTIEQEITNNGPVNVSQIITFQGTCKSQNITKLVLCHDNIACNLETPQEQILCQSDSSADAQKSCSYTATASDVGENDNDIATCCAVEGRCAETTVIVQSWTVQGTPQETNVTKIVGEVSLEPPVDTGEEVVEGAIQQQAAINKSVAWIKKIKLSQPTANPRTKIHKKASEIKVQKIKNNNREELLPAQWAEEVSEAGKDLVLHDTIEEAEITYVTPPPTVTEEEVTPYRKQVTVSSDIYYTNVAAYTDIPETPEKKLRLFQMVNGSRQLADNVVYRDTNGDKLIDRLEWSIPHLSNETYEVIMVTKADHLDENKVFLTDIYNEVKLLDDLWSETIPESHYVRVTFDVPLTPRHDISIYPRIVSGNPKVIVYELNKSEPIGEFTTIIPNQFNKIYLTELQEPQDTFDLHIVDGALEFDQIVDPTLVISNITTMCNGVTAYDTIVVDTTGELEVCYQNGIMTTGYVNITLGSVGNFTVAPGGVVNGTGGGANGGPGASSGCGTQGRNGQNFTAGVAKCLANEGGGGPGSDAASTGDSAGGGGGGFGGGGGTGGKSASGGIVGAAGLTYGEKNEQDLNLSGSGGGGSSGDDANKGGAGGAGFRVDAGSGEINIQGTVNINGKNGMDGTGVDSGGGGGGSGGHVILIAKKLNFNNGVISADGGHGGSGGSTNDGCGGGGGGGGRVVYVYNEISEVSFTNSTDGGTRGPNPDSGPCAALSTHGTNGTVFYNQSAFADLSPPIYDTESIVANPTSGATYSLTQFYEFNVTWTDDSQISNVFIVFNGTNYSLAKNEVYNTTGTPDVFQFNVTGLAATDYTYTWFANDSSNLENQTGAQSYTVAKAEPDVNLSLNDVYGNVTITEGDTVNHTAEILTGEGSPQLFRNDTLMNVEGSPAISNVTNYTLDLGAGVYNITAFYPQTENYTTNFTEFFVIVNAPAANAPVVQDINGPDYTIATQSVTEDGITNLMVTFAVYDADGVTNIDDTSANLTLVNETGSGVDTHYNTTCRTETDIDGNTANYTCTVEINYWYVAGTWNLTAGIQDTDGNAGENETNFTLQETTAIAISPEGMTFPGLTIGAENTTSDNDPIVVNNTANDYIDSNNVRITGLDLVGEVTDSMAITTANFTVAPFNGDSPPQECVNTALVNNTATGINGTDLAAGNRSIANVGIEQLYVCLNIVPTGLTAQTYSTANSTVGWVLSVV